MKKLNRTFLLRTGSSILFVLMCIISFAQGGNELQSAIKEYKRSFYQVGCKSALLESQINRIFDLDYTLVKKCQSCRGSGQISNQKDCKYCNGTGISSCSYCSNGHITCSNCKGTGQVFCSCAYETLSDVILKYHHYDTNCSICGGRTGGKGLLNCGSCNGNGKTSCPSCNGSNEMRCRSCKNGSVNSSECCEECKGLGRLVE